LSLAGRWVEQWSDCWSRTSRCIASSPERAPKVRGGQRREWSRRRPPRGRCRPGLAAWKPRRGFAPSHLSSLLLASSSNTDHTGYAQTLGATLSASLAPNPKGCFKPPPGRPTLAGHDPCPAMLLPWRHSLQSPPRCLSSAWSEVSYPMLIAHSRLQISTCRPDSEFAGG
jgi:hypothetical protein